MIIAFILIIILAAFCLYLRARVEELEQRIDLLEVKRSERPVSLAVEAHHTVVQEEPPPLPPPLPLAVPPLVPDALPQPEPFAWSRPEPTAPPAPVEPVPTLSDRLRALLGDEEWETLVGGSLLNKLGALVLVIGIALFLGFSFTHMTPGGRASISLLVSVAILGTGVWVERRERYRVFARGLIGAGWAALYATAYAAYAVPEARVIENPFTGSIGLLFVAAGMIVHSLRYRAQAVTGVAYFAAFAALAATPSSPFAVISLIPLAASILYLAAKFDWYSMALFGLFATWGTCISRGESNAPLAETQTLFIVYWVLFEAFDLLRAKRDVVAGGVEWIYPGNLAGFIGLSYLSWAHHAPERLWLAAAAGSAVFLADAIVRAFIRLPDEDLIENLRRGSYESSIFVSAVLGGLAIVGRVPGLWMSAGLAVEAEILYIAGVRFNSAFLRRMGFTAFAHSLARVVWGEPVDKSNVLGHETWNQTPPLLFHAVLFYLNRALRQPNVVMSSAAAVLVAAAILVEVPQGYVGMAWVFYGLALFEIGLRLRQFDFRAQAYGLLIAATAMNTLQPAIPGLALSLAGVYLCALRSRWIDVPERVGIAYGGSAATALLSAFLVWRTVPDEYVALAWCVLAVVVLELGIRRFPAEMRLCFAPIGVLAIGGVVARHTNDFLKFPAADISITYFGAALTAAIAAWRNSDKAAFRDSSAGIGAAAALAGIWLVVPDPYVSVIWTLLGLAVLELGVAIPLDSLRWIACAPFVVIYYRLFDFDVDAAPLRAMPVAIAGLYWLWYRLRDEVQVSRIVFWAAVIPLLALIEREAGFRDASLGWMVVALVLLVFGTRDALIQSYVIAAMAFAIALAGDGRVWVCGATAAALYGAQFLSKTRRASAFFSVAGTLLLGAILYREVSGGLLTVSWGFEGLALLGCGFGTRERILRLQGLALLLVCILKLFIYDLRNLETLYRILSFIALGLILLGVSWIYTRFREHLRKIL